MKNHPEIEYELNVVKTKVMNEKKERKRKLERGLALLKYVRIVLSHTILTCISTYRWGLMYTTVSGIVQLS